MSTSSKRRQLRNHENFWYTSSVNRPYIDRDSLAAIRDSRETAWKETHEKEGSAARSDKYKERKERIRLNHLENKNKKKIKTKELVKVKMTRQQELAASRERRRSLGWDKSSLLMPSNELHRAARKIEDMYIRRNKKFRGARSEIKINLTKQAVNFVREIEGEAENA